MEQNQVGKVLSIDKVGDELQAGDDELSTWADSQGEHFFIRPDNLVLPALPRVSAWVSGQAYQPAAVSTFLQVADYWLVAHALAHKMTVVTHEVPSDSDGRIRAPPECVR